MPVTLICAWCGRSYVEPPSEAARGRRYSGNACRGAASRIAPADRFWDKVEKNGPVSAPDLGPCWVWTGDRHEHGYGRLKETGTRATVYAHRLSYELHHGPIPPDHHVCHRCDNPPCVNPAHLFAGTDRDNHADRDAKNRVRHGERHANAKLTADKARVIRALYAAGGVSQRKIAQLYGVSHQTISELLRGENWRRV